VTHEANFLVQETRKRCDENHDPQIVERQRDAKEQSGPFLVIDFTITCIKKMIIASSANLLDRLPKQRPSSQSGA
jgi:hypothetical protein